MTQPQVTITEIDGALGVLPASAGSLTAFVGSSTTGPLNTPATFARTTALIETFGGGEVVEAAAYYINVTGRPVVISRAEATTVAAVSTPVKTGPGTYTVTVGATPAPVDNYEYKVRFLNDVTLGGVDVAKYQLSYDNGRSYGAQTALGVDGIINAGGVVFTIGATGTIVEGDAFTARATASQWSGTELAAAIAPLGTSTILWEQLIVVGELDADAFDVVDTTVKGWRTSGKYRSWIGGARVPDIDESPATYQAAMSTEFADKATTLGTVCGAACKVTSGVSGRKYRRSTVFAIAAAQAVSEEIDIADVNLGSLPGVAIRDTNGNVDEHDESANPGLDDARLTVLRTWDGYPGVYVNRPRIFSVEGSDFQLIPHRRVLNLTEAILRNYFIRRLNRPIRVDKTTGFILEADALEIEGGAVAAMRSGLLAKPKASDVQFILSRTDNILATKTLSGTARVVPLAYPEFINIEVGFFNPALAVAA